MYFNEPEPTGLPCRLLPALLRFAEEDAPPECQAHALRFVEFCIHHLENDDPAIHHLAVMSNGLAADNPQSASIAYHKVQITIHSSDPHTIEPCKLCFHLLLPLASRYCSRHRGRLRAMLELTCQGIVL